MTSTAIFIAAMILVPAVGVAVWVWSAMDRVEEDLRSLSGFTGEYFEIGPQARNGAGGMR